STNPRLGHLGLNLLRAGYSAPRVLAEIAASDQFVERRQLGCLDPTGLAAARTGKDNKPWAGHRVDKNVVVAANAVVSEKVADGMFATFQQDPALPLWERLLRALEAGKAAGGQPNGEVSSGLFVVDREPYAMVDLRVDPNPSPVTDGFRDVLELQRLRLPNPFDLDGARPLPLIPRARVAEVREGLRANGSIDTPLDADSVRDAARHLADHHPDGLVISFMHSYRNPAHERGARALVEAAIPDMPVNTSSDVWPQAREYERTALAVLDAYVQPKVRRYLEGFESALAARGVPATPHVTKSNGGIMPVAAARRQTVATLLSGPASGVIGAAYVAGEAGLPNVITLDVGGTSADIAVVEGGRP